MSFLLLIEIDMVETDVLIVGSGPVGIFGAFQAGMLGMKSYIVDCLDFVGGQCVALYPEKPIHDIPSYKSINAKDLIDNLIDQASQFNPVYHLSDTVEKINGNAGNFEILTKNGKNIRAKSIIIAAGSGVFGPNKPPLENIEKYENKSIFYFINNVDSFKDRDILIAGAGDSAADWAIMLSGIANSVSIVHRRENMRCHSSTELKIKQLCNDGVIKFYQPYQLDGIIGDVNSGNIDHVNIKHITSHEIINVKANILLPFFGLMTNLGPINNWGLDVHDRGISVEVSTMETNINGIFAAGDVASYKGKLKLILSGFSEIATAMHSAYHYVFPDKALHFTHSTSNHVFDGK
jgi:thioredoxin reductase (NADPH)